MSADSAPLLPSLYTGLEAGEEECQPISIVFFIYIIGGGWNLEGGSGLPQGPTCWHGYLLC